MKCRLPIQGANLSEKTDVKADYVTARQRRLLQKQMKNIEKKLNVNPLHSLSNFAYLFLLFVLFCAAVFHLHLSVCDVCTVPCFCYSINALQKNNSKNKCLLFSGFEDGSGVRCPRYPRIHSTAEE